MINPTKLKKSSKASVEDYKLNFALVEAIQSMGAGGTGAEAIIAYLCLGHYQSFVQYFNKLENILGNAVKNTFLKSYWWRKNWLLVIYHAMMRLFHWYCHKVRFIMINNSNLLTIISSDLMYKLDMGWSKRSSGRRYDSQLGHNVLIGQSSKKITDCVLYTKSLRICANSAGKSIEPRQHECTIHWTESIKSMECKGTVHLCCEAPKNTPFLN